MDSTAKPELCQLKVVFTIDKFKAASPVSHCSFAIFIEPHGREYVGEGRAAVPHTAGDLLHWHPHVHALCLNGSVDAQNGFSERSL